MPTSITVRPWPDPVIDTIGHDPRSLYVESFWLPTLGPTSVLLLRHLAARFEHSPDGVELPLADTSHALGLGRREGMSSPLVRTLARLAQFDLAREDGRGGVDVRRNLPPVNRRHLHRLPEHLQAAHAAWAQARLGESPLVEARRRARRLALALVDEGGDVDSVERALHGIGYHPSICRESAAWAWAEHHGPAEAAAGAAGATGAVEVAAAG